MASREERAAEKMGDIFADERLNVVQLGYLTSMYWTQGMMDRFMGWFHWHNEIAKSVNLRDDGGVDFIQGDYLEFIRRNERLKK